MRYNPDFNSEKIGGKNFKKAIKDIVISHVAFAYNFETLAQAV
ncbi:hypothetical protein [Mycoplasma putrefaciens]|nr:hypothetical protein [Mycoplasma putrefaciens]